MESIRGYTDSRRDDRENIPVRLKVPEGLEVIEGMTGEMITKEILTEERKGALIDTRQHLLL